MPSNMPATKKKKKRKKTEEKKKREKKRRPATFSSAVDAYRASLPQGLPSPLLVAVQK
jgi:hypothetical protein